MKEILLILIALGIIYLIYQQRKKKLKPIKLTPESLKRWEVILNKEVNFYYNLSAERKILFRDRVASFLSSVKITAVGTKINESDRLLIGASAIIPVFEFPNWEYIYLDEVLVYANSFNERYDTQSRDNNILGMVGSGVMNNKMILSLQALRLGFSNEKDKSNTAIHEFVHLIDKQDGVIDGVPKALLDSNYITPWLDLINKKMTEITNDKSDIRNYGAYNKQEFYTVASEYFFERPKLMAKKHPELFKYMNEIYKNTPVLDNEYQAQDLGRNSPCPCGSGKKYKKCCMKTK